jgi:hypothetical protein
MRVVPRSVAIVLATLATLAAAGCDAPTPDGAGSPDVRPGASAGGGTRSPSRALPPGVLLLTRASIEDPGVIAPGTALTVLLPVGWRGSGGVVPGAGPCDMPYAVNWTATSDDGTSTIAIFPTESWQAATYGANGGCPDGDFTTVEDYLQARLDRAWPGAQLVAYRDREDYAAAVMDDVARQQQLFAQSGLSAEVRAGGGEVRFTFERDGRPMEGTMGVSAIFYTTRMPNPMGGPPLTTITGSTLGTFAATAPAGRLDTVLVEATRRSIRPDGQWLQQLGALMHRLNQAAVDGTRTRAAIIVAGGAAATASNIETMRDATGYNGGREAFPGDAAGDRMQRRSIEAIRGVNSYEDPVSGATVQLDHTFDHAWRVTNADAYLLTRDPNFNPGQFGIEATRMKVIR